MVFAEQPGLLKKVQGMGWYLDEANVAQVSTNILDYELTPLHTVYQEICRGAEVGGRHGFRAGRCNSLYSCVRASETCCCVSRT